MCAGAYEHASATGGDTSTTTAVRRYEQRERERERVF